MEATDILAQARTNPETPHGWVLFPLSRSKLAIGIAGWALGITLGLGLFTAAALVTIPGNYQHGGILGIIVTTFILGTLLFIGLGSVWTLIVDVLRLQRADQYLIVITPEDFVKQEREKIIHVPLAYIRHVTARGKPPVDGAAPKGNVLGEVPRARENLSGFILGRGLVPSGERLRRKRMRTPTSLAFIDSRDDSEVTVVTDEAYGDPFMIAALLKQYASSVQSLV